MNRITAERRQIDRPAARAGTPEEIAKTAAFLLSSDASYITGQSILADGGLNRSI